MKKVLLIGFIILCIFQIMVMATAIDIGNPAIDRASKGSTDRRTYVDMNNPANETGTLTTVQIYAWGEMSNVEVATFYVVSGNNLSTRDTHTIGTVAVGYNSFSGLDIDVVAGDYIGETHSGGAVDRDDTGGAGMWYTSADNIPCTNVTFSVSAGKINSIYGIGATLPAGITWNTKTISKWNTKTISTWNGM